MECLLRLEDGAGLRPQEVPMKRLVIALMVVTFTLASAPILYAQKGPKVNKSPSEGYGHTPSRSR